MIAGLPLALLSSALGCVAIGAIAALAGGTPAVVLAVAGPYVALSLWPSLAASRRRVGGIGGFLGLASEIALLSLPVMFFGLLFVVRPTRLGFELGFGETEEASLLGFALACGVGTVAALPVAVSACLGSPPSRESPFATAARATTVAVLVVATGLWVAPVLQDRPLLELALVDVVAVVVFLAVLTVSRRGSEPPTPA